ncbi:hypothetical protein JCM1841_000436 [Sporobolomyces salmonicolor]
MVTAPVDLVPLGLVSDFQQSHRYVVSFRNWLNPVEHSQLLIYRQDDNQRWYGIANECPHLSLPLEQGDIEDLCESTSHDGADSDENPASQPIILCPFHQYDWGLRDGQSSTGMRACTYRVEARDDGRLWMEPPGDRGDDYRLLGVRIVSERFASSASPPAAADLASLLSSISLCADLTSSSSSPSAITIPPAPSSPSQPTSIVGWARLILLAPSPTAKVSLTRHLVALFRSGQLTRLSSPSDPPQPAEPYRAPSVVTVAPGQALKLGKAGSVQNRIKLLHALAAIEQWAIDLAVDCVARFYDWRVGADDGKEGKRMPWSFVADFLKVAEDEAKHFTLLSERLEQLGSKYGDLAVHNGLWESATATSHSLFARLAVIHLVHEARGLDSNPMQIKRCRAAGDEESAKVLEVIHWDEITHVATGHRHFVHLCANHAPPLDPVITFRHEVSSHFFGALRGPFNEEDRLKAGMEKGWYDGLRGRGAGGAKAEMEGPEGTKAQCEGRGSEAAGVKVTAGAAGKSASQ